MTNNNKSNTRIAEHSCCCLQFFSDQHGGEDGEKDDDADHPLSARCLDMGEKQQEAPKINKRDVGNGKVHENVYGFCKICSNRETARCT